MKDDLNPPTTTSSSEDRGTTGGRSRRRRPYASALRDEIPPLGLRQYWYPAMAASAVGTRRPASVKLLGDDITLFRDRDGDVAAVSSICPHRGADMSRGRSHFKGTITCPYHGWTFGADGQCLAVLGEGPESNIPGTSSARIRSYPARTLKGIVFVWMGEGEPAPIEEDVPDHLFDEKTLVQFTIRKWRCNWRPAVENLLDAHVFYLHRNSLQLLLSRPKGVMALAKMGPTRPKPGLVNGRGLTYKPEDIPFLSAVANTEGKDPAKGSERSEPANSVAFQDAYPSLWGGKWPKTKARLYFARMVAPFLRAAPPDPFVKSKEWTNFHLPTTFQVDYHSYLYSRITIPVDEETSRVLYLFATRPAGSLKRLWDKLVFRVYLDWKLNSNFSNQDKRVVETQNYASDEKLSATDVFPLEIRRLILSHGRDFTA